MNHTKERFVIMIRGRFLQDYSGNDYTLCSHSDGCLIWTDRAAANEAAEFIRFIIRNFGQDRYPDLGHVMVLEVAQ